MLNKLRELFTSTPNDDTPPEEVLAAAMEKVDGRLPHGLFHQLNRLKSDRIPRRNTDYLRARYFISKGNTNSAVEALKEELRYFPDNEAAAKLLSDLGGGHSAPTRLGDAEFQELHKTISRYTMVGEQRLLCMHTQAKELCLKDVAGNFVECGVAAGGSSALLAAVIRRHSRRPRLHFAFDTFEGMPDPGEEDRHGKHAADEGGWGAGTCAAPESSLMEAATQVGAASLVKPVKGFFADTLPVWRQEIGPIAFLHMDGDWYSSTRDILVNLYDQVVPGGVIQIDDYGYWQGCRQALAEFQAERKIQLEFTPIDSTGVWFIKGSGQ